jgi:protein arginine kinase
VLLHLPALVFTQGVDNIINITQQLGLSMRAVYVGGKQGQQYGNIFQVANQLTLGFSEEEIIANLKSAVGEIVSHENKARQVLKSYRGSKIEDMVWRAFGVLRYARLLGEGEALDLFSKVRLGIDLGFIVGVRADFFGEAILACQECFLKQKTGRENMSSGELEKMRGLTARKLLHKYMKLKDEREEKDRESNVEPKTANETANEGENK